MEFFFLIFVCFFIFVLCSLCGFCCRKTEQGAIYSTPVVVTSSTHQPPGGHAYPIQTHQTTITASSTNSPVAMPMPFPQSGPYNAPYPPTGVAAPYPPTNIAPYPPVNSSYGASAPYPTMNPAMQNPPSYTEVMGPNNAYPNAPPAADVYQKQSPYNPGYQN